MEKPVIILGGGMWGALLAYRLKDALPHVPFKLYEAHSTLGNQKSCSFKEKDCRNSMGWLKPLISHSWENHELMIKKFSLRVPAPVHLIDSEKLHEVVLGKVGEEIIRLNNNMSAELALKEGAFVIDARNICYFKKISYRQIHTVEIELKDAHNMTSPVHAHFGNYKFYPLDSHRLLIHHFEDSSSKTLEVDHLRSSFNDLVQSHSWSITKIIKEHFKIVEVPLSAPRFRQDGRVINLAGIFHDSHGCSIPMATKLIDQMVETSFRFGELREVVKTYRKEVEAERRISRFFNRLLNLRKWTFQPFAELKAQ